MEKLLDKIVTIIFVVALVAILYFVGQYVVKKMGTKSTADNIDQVDDNDPFSDAEDVDDINDTFDPEGGEYYGEDDNDDEEAVPEGYDDEIAKIMEDVVSDSEKKAASAADAVKNGVKSAEKTTAAATKAIADKVTGDNSEATKKTASNTSADEDDSRYMVVAGSFTSNANADKHATKLEKEGFTPEIVNFNNSRMYTVVASRYDNEADALAAAKKLRAVKIDCYVHRKRKK